MTAEEWIANIANEQDRKYAREAVNAALEKERAGEVVLGVGDLEVGLNAALVFKGYAELRKKTGSLIFREEGK